MCLSNLDRRAAYLLSSSAEFLTFCKISSIFQHHMNAFMQRGVYSYAEKSFLRATRSSSSSSTKVSVVLAVRSVDGLAVRLGGERPQMLRLCGLAGSLRAHSGDIREPPGRWELVA